MTTPEDKSRPRARGVAPPRRAVGAFLLAAVAACGGAEPTDARVLRVGHFPNLTHAQGVIGHGATRRGDGWFEKRLPPGTRVEWSVYNAGPSAMEALLVGAIDLAYVGPNPALNAYVRSGGEDVRVVAGAALGGAALVVPGASSARVPEDFRGRRLATPQFGNTQDVACRNWLLKGGLRISATGGDADVVPTPNPDQLALFASGALAGVWTVEPWVSRLELEAGGKVLFAEDDALTTVLVASARALRERRELVRAFVAAHGELSAWIVDRGDEAQARVREEILAETQRELPEALLKRAWPRVRFDARLPKEAFVRTLAEAQAAGFLKDAPALDRLTEAP